MTRTQTAKSLCKNTLLYLGLAVTVVAAIPLLAGLAWAVRLLVPILLVAVVVAVIASPRLRGWFMAEADSSPSYHGVATPTYGLWLHPGHAWARMEGPGTASVGTDSLALVALGRVHMVEAPAVGTNVVQGQTVFTLHHGQRRLEVKSPVGGTIAEVNPEAAARPALLGESPYGAGWVVRLRGVELAKERRFLKHGSALRHWWRTEVDRLLHCLGSQAGMPTMADGGALLSDLSNVLDDAQWNQIARELFGQGGA
jgi:glycine cleavage system H protein